MLGGNMQFNRSKSDDRFYIPVKSRKNKKNSQLERTQSDIGVGTKCRDNKMVSGIGRPGESPNPPVELPLSNIERFLESITPSVDLQYLSKTTVRGWTTCDVKFQPYFMLSDLWESFKEWSAYGVGVPLVLNGSDSVIQYYVPYLSAIQIYIHPSKSKSSVKSRRTSEDSDVDFFSRDSSSDGSSDSERDRGLAYSRWQRNQFSHPIDISHRMNRLNLRDPHSVLQEGFSSDEGESPQACLLFEYFEHDQPYGREPLADKIADLALRFPELKSLRSCDVLASSWFSVAWYPIYRIPMGPTLKDLEACFLTYHSLYTPVGDVPPAQAPVVIYPSEIDGNPRISLPVFGLASYKFRGSLWTSNSGSDRQLVNELMQGADSWLRRLQVITETGFRLTSIGKKKEKPLYVYHVEALHNTNAIC